jgi:hypothetical protein
MENTNTIVTTEEYNAAVKSWIGFIFKNMYRISQINNLDYSSQQELIHIGKIAVYEALLSSKTNGKTGNDANGLIKTYITGRMQRHVDETMKLVKIPIRWIYNDEHRELNCGYIPHHYQEEKGYEIADENSYEDENVIKKKLILQVLSKQTNQEKEIYLHKFGLFGRKPMTYKELRDEYNMPIHHLEKIIRPLTQTIKEKYAKHIQSIT